MCPITGTKPSQRKGVVITMKIKIDIENKDNVIADLEKIISMAEELKYRLSTFKSPEVIVKGEPLAETAERLKNSIVK